MPAVPSDEEFRAYNEGVISEFRANHGVVSQPPFPILLLTTTGARTGRPTTAPLAYGVDDRGRVFVVGSKAGAPTHPAWFHNLRANPSVTVELGGESFAARAVITAGEERERLYGMISGGMSEYEKNTDRVFPVVVLEGVPAPPSHPILGDAVRYVLDGPHLSVLATIEPDGRPQTSVIFVKQDGDHILFSTIEGRRKTTNMRRDPRVNLFIHGLPVDRPNRAGDGPNYVAISGTVELADDRSGTFHQEMYALHMGGATPPPEPDARRLIVRILPDHVYVPRFP